MLAWHLNVGDAKFGSALEKYGRMSVPVRSATNEMSWPQAVDDSLEEFLREGLGRAAHFVADRTDLCELLSSSEDVHQGNLYAWLPVANYPARLVQSLVLARDTGSSALESRIRGQLAQEPIRLSNGRFMDVMVGQGVGESIFKSARV
ncbi:hypothetical protein [Streptomyces lanatus]|uniref:Uncharacterized protein n=1 Tax=Streptomyces lanatus TaxID=66900 RepID=A0ABV1XV80_9ACTN|nr:hypothetical protein [Streptomyces lanatus]